MANLDWADRKTGYASGWRQQLDDLDDLIRTNEKVNKKTSVRLEKSSSNKGLNAACSGEGACDQKAAAYTDCRKDERWNWKKDGVMGVGNTCPRCRR